MKQLVQKIFSAMGMEIRKKRSVQRASMHGALMQLRHMGFKPKYIIDIGAAFGDWTRISAPIFPEASHILVEPLEEFGVSLRQLSSIIPSLTIIKGILGRENGELIFNVHKDLVGSSIFDETEDNDDILEEKRLVPSFTLDSITQEFPGPYLIKIDAQGAELEILKSGQRAMKSAEVIILEVSFFQSVKQSPLLDEICFFMRKNGFVPYDLLGQSYRPLDNALSQIDILFAKETGFLRNDHRYATKEQRRRQNEHFKKKNYLRM